MSKAEERACQYTGYCRNQSFKDYLNGDHQAEQDNELTLEDIGIIINAFLDLCIENKEQGKTKRYTDKEYCQEVLKRFKDLKKCI